MRAMHLSTNILICFFSDLHMQMQGETRHSAQCGLNDATHGRNGLPSLVICLVLDNFSYHTEDSFE